ncbi:MAG: hypothetical protein AAF997_00335 [Myxococcota bacterium]
MARFRSHLALTVWPIVVLLLLEVARLWPALGGATEYAASSPESWLSLVARSALVLAFFTAYVRGWALLRRADPDGPGPYASVGSRRLQRGAGGLAWAMVLGHLGLQWFMFLTVGPASLSHYEIFRETLSLPWVLGAYMLGFGAFGVFVSQGLPAALRAMGYAERPETSRWLAVGCTFFTAIMLMLAVNILSHFATGRAYWFSSEPPSSSPNDGRDSAP